MKTNNDQKPEFVKDNSLVKNANENESLKLSIDKTLATYKSLSNFPGEEISTNYQRKYKDLLREKKVLLKATRAILKSAIKGTKKRIELFYPSLLKWDESRRYYQLWTERPFCEEMIEYLGRDIKSIKCLCEDGKERTFEINKIEAFIGYGPKRNSTPKQCVNVYFCCKRADNTLQGSKGGMAIYGPSYTEGGQKIDYSGLFD